VILLQTGKGAGMGAAFGGGGSQTVFGPRGAGSFIGKVTAVIAIMFMITSIILAKLSSSQRTGIAERVSALNETRAREVNEVDLSGKTGKATPETKTPVKLKTDEGLKPDAGLLDAGSLGAGSVQQPAKTSDTGAAAKTGQTEKQDKPIDSGVQNQKNN
jgi:preprotein translocase subunit SecG